jgi:hypothetical protein
VRSEVLKYAMAAILRSAMSSAKICNQEKVPKFPSLCDTELSVPKIRFRNNDDEVRRGQAQLRCGLRAGWRDGSERLCRETDESSTHYNKRHTSLEPA